MLIRMNSLIRGHSGVRWELIEKIAEIFDANITPVVPLRSSISASGGQFLRDSCVINDPNLTSFVLDLSPLSYIAGTVGGCSSFSHDIRT